MIMKTVLKNNNHQSLVENNEPGAGKVGKPDVWFSINKKGIFHSLSPLLLDYLEDMDHLFFESCLVEDNQKQGLPSPVEFLKEMINTERESNFVEEVIKNNKNSSLNSIWDIIAEGGHLKFSLGEEGA